LGEPDGQLAPAHDAEAQQTPSTANPLWHWLPVPASIPFARFGLQAPAEQKLPPAQSLSDEQDVLQAPELQV
jgi:hypothetical protein